LHRWRNDVTLPIHTLLKQGIATNENIGFLIAAARRRITQAVGGQVRRYRLSPRQFWILVAVYEHRGSSLKELATHLRMDEPTASRVVFALRRRKLLEVRDDAADRRRSRLYLGASGRVLARELHALASFIRDAVTRGLTGSEREALRASLRKIIANMDRFPSGNGASNGAREGRA
jgi:DNA-binding MarR family transcriptional regulator